jgi:ABC-type Mn2+/Zn2+ transport system permease subunit
MDFEDLKKLGFMQSLIAIAILVGFFGCIYLVMRHDVNESMRDALLILIGSLGAAFGAVVNYYFGSSKGSHDKTKLLAEKDPNAT